MLLGKPGDIAALALDRLTVVRQRKVDALIEELDR